MEASAVARLRVRPSAADVRAWLGEPRHRGEGSKPYWIYRWRAPRAAEGCQLLVAFDPYSGRVTAYQVNRYARSRVFVVDAWPGSVPDATHSGQCLRGAPPS
jgi:hypothetical protein